MVKKYYVTWQELEKFVLEVVERYKDTKITGVYGIPRGGCILATLVSYKMDIPMLYAPCKDCIIIDDISDTGETLLHYDRNTANGCEDNRYHIVTMYYREGSLVKPEFFKYYKTDKWIVYPWEN